MGGKFIQSNLCGSCGQHMFVCLLYFSIPAIQEKACCILNKISFKLALDGPSDHTEALVQLMARCRRGTKPLSELMITPFTYAYVRYRT